MVTLYIFLGIVLFLILKKAKGTSMKLKLPPGPKGYPFIGCTLEINETNIINKLFANAEEYGELYEICLLKKKFLCLNSEKVIRKVLAVEPWRMYMNDKVNLFVTEITRFGGQSVGTFGDVHDPVFSGMRKGIIHGLHAYGKDGMNEVEEKILKEITRLNKTIESFGNKEFDVMALLKRSLTNVISVMLSGEPIEDGDTDADMFWGYIEGSDYFFNATVNSLLTLFPVLRFAPGINRKYKFLIRGMNKIRERYFYSRKNRGDDEPQGLADFLIKLQRQAQEEGKDVIFTDERIMANIQETVLAGILTTWSILSSTISCLISNQDYQNKVFKEIDEQIGRDRPPMHTDTINCPHLEALELEAHHFLTVAPILFGRICNQDTTLEGYDIAKGTSLMVNIWHMHHDPKIWGDPWEFRPERFLDADGMLLPRDHVFRRNWMAFSIGRRQCLGEQFARSRYFLYMASLLGRWKFVGSPGKFRKCDPRNLENIDTNVTVRPKPFFCTVERRY